MLKRLQVRNFKSLRELEVEFGRLTVLVGANGCGKSSVLQAIKLVRDLALVPPSTFTLDPELVSRGIGGTQLLPWFLLAVDDKHVDVAVEAVFDSSNPPLLTLNQDHSRVRVSSKDGTSEPVTHSLNEGRGDLRPWLDHIKLYQLDAEIMARPSYSEQANPVLGSRGENFGSVLDALQGNRREQFEAIESVLCGFITGLRRIRLRRVPMPLERTILVGNEYRTVRDNTVGHQLVLDFEFAAGVSAEHASEGTVLLLGLLTLIGTEPGPPMTIMLDDLDRALHPKAQRQLVEHLHQLLDQRPELQIIATSHSPYLVEHLAYDEVLAMTQSPVDGRSLIAPLASHPDADGWRHEMTAGEFWSNVGEDWIAQTTGR